MSETISTEHTASKMHNEEYYKHLYVVTEQEEGKLLAVNFEMLGEARRLMDNFNTKYSTDEKVIAVLLGKDMRDLCNDLIVHGADAVIYAEDPELEYHRNLIYTKVICQIARDKESLRKISPKYSDTFKKPRYMFFSADDTGRHLSATVLAELESGLASDINKLAIEDLEIKHEHKTKGRVEKYEKILEMYRPDFSGFLWTTILCLDNRNPSNRREYHPQGCSIIPGVFSPIVPDTARKGVIISYNPSIAKEDLNVRILSRKVIKSPIDFDNHKAIVSFGRGIRDSPEKNIKLIRDLAIELNAEIGISLPISKKPYSISDSRLSVYMTPERVIGTSGRTVSPLLYITAGISGAMQHTAGMKNSGFVVTVNPDSDCSMKDESDIFIKGRMEDVLPILIDEMRKLRPAVQVSK